MTTESWSISPSMPTGTERQYASGFSSTNSGYVFGGVNSDYLNDLWMFNEQSNQWVLNHLYPLLAEPDQAVW
ncbi:MAG: hypothetical protein H0V01_12440 [Bacteroidetes bacterium]|nr:hypothetical protein [Bacteroidota bacterium]